MDIETTYEPTETLEDHFLPIDRTVWHIHTDQSEEDARKTIEAFKRELKQKRVPAKPAEVQHVYVPVPVPDCLVDNRTDTPSWSRSQKDNEGAQVAPAEDETMVVRRIRKRIAQIEKIDRRTWGLYYGAMDVWSILSSAFWKTAEVLNAIRTLGAARVRRYFSRRIKQLAVSIEHERQKDRKAGS